MEENSLLFYGVYIKINSKNEIISIQSSAFISDFDNWIKIDEGVGDKFYHAQSQYLTDNLVDESGCYNYEYKNGRVVNNPNKDAERSINEAQIEIENLKYKLTETDYIIAKIAEGVATKEEYSDKLTDRAKWRKKINELEEVIKCL